MLAVTFVDRQVVVGARPDPVIGPDGVMVAVAGAGLNGADLLQRAGNYPAPPRIPDDQPGLEFAGRVTAVGSNVSRWQVDDRVMGIVAGAGQSGLVATHQDLLMAVPETVDIVTAGAIPEALITAHDALFSQGRMALGDRVLITGAAGGVGTAAVQLAVAAGGYVVASVRRQAAHGEIAALGASEVVVPDAQAEAGPFDVIVELVGGPSLVTVAKSLATGARVVVIGVGGGARVDLNLLHLMQARATLGGSTLRARPLADKVMATRAAEHAFASLQAAGGWITPVASVHDLEDAPAAYDRFEAGGYVGKVVLEL